MVDIYDQIAGRKRNAVFKEIIVLATEDNRQETETLLTIDATTEFRFTQGLDITTHPIEEDGDITDHARVQLEDISISGIMTESPLSLLNSFTNSAMGGIGSTLGGLSGAAITAGASKMSDTIMDERDEDGLPAGGQQRVGKAKEILNRIVKDKILLNLTIKNHVSNNLLIESITFVDNVDVGNSLVFDAILKEVKFVFGKTRKVERRKAKGMAKKSAVSKTKKGLQQAKAAKQKLKDDSGSALYRTSKALGFFKD